MLEVDSCVCSGVNVWALLLVIMTKEPDFTAEKKTQHMGISERLGGL